MTDPKNIIPLNPGAAKAGRPFGRVDQAILDQLLMMEAQITQMSRSNPDLTGDLDLISSLIRAVREDFKDRR